MENSFRTLKEKNWYAFGLKSVCIIMNILVENIAKMLSVYKKIFETLFTCLLPNPPNLSPEKGTYVIFILHCIYYCKKDISSMIDDKLSQ